NDRLRVSRGLVVRHLAHAGRDAVHAAHARRALQRPGERDESFAQVARKLVRVEFPQVDLVGLSQALLDWTIARQHGDGIPEAIPVGQHLHPRRPELISFYSSGACAVLFKLIPRAWSREFFVKSGPYGWNIRRCRG